MAPMNDPLKNEVDHVLGAKNTIIEACKKYLDTLRPTINAICDDVKDVQFSRQLIYRCITKRAEESFGAIINMAETSDSFIGPLALRPMCEDLIYGCWLATLPPSDADMFTVLDAKDNMLKSLHAQVNFLPRAYERFSKLPREDMKKFIGMSADEVGEFTANQSTIIDAERQKIRTELRALGSKLGWPGGRMPSTYSMANRCQLEEIYSFFYHGSSKAVHSDLHHMSQMVLRSSEDGFAISSKGMAPSSSLFALTYGIWITDEIFGRIVEREFPHEHSLIDMDARSVWLALVLVGLARNRAFPRLVSMDEEFGFLKSLDSQDPA